jgi:small subunit ribosomal protein S5
LKKLNLILIKYKMAEENKKPVEEEHPLEALQEVPKAKDDLSIVEDEYAEKPEDVLDESELKELKEMEKENGKEKKEEKSEEEIRNEARKKQERARRGELTREEIVEAWTTKTKLGEEVKRGKIKDIDEIIDSNKKILEPQIVDSLIPIKMDLISIGQAKGKFGGGKRRAWRQTQRKTKEGNVPTFSTMAVVGDGNGHVGIGVGKAMETLPARDKAIRQAKLNVIKINRSCAAFDCDCSEKHSVPFKVNGKAGSVRVELIPAPQGTGLVVANELKKILKAAGIQDVYSKTYGKIRTTFNLAKACMDALKKTNPIYDEAKK